MNTGPLNTFEKGVEGMLRNRYYTYFRPSFTLFTKGSSVLASLVLYCSVAGSILAHTGLEVKL